MEGLEKITIKDIMNDLKVSESLACKYLKDIRVEFELVKPKPVTRTHLLKYLHLL